MSAVRGTRGWLGVGLLAAVAATLPYLGALEFDLLHRDDARYIQAQRYWADPSLANLWDVVRRPVFISIAPVQLASYWLDRRLWGPRPLGLRVTQVALHAACAAAVVALARRAGLSRAGGAAAGLAFAWHPTHVEVVAWVAQRKDLLYLLLGLLALLAWLGPRPAALDDPGAPPPGPRGRLAAVGLLGLALLSKVSAVVLGPWLVLASWGRGRVRADLTWLAVAAALTAALLWASFGLHAQAGAVSGGGPAERAALMARTYAWYALATVGAAPDSAAPAPPGAGGLVAGLALLTAATGAAVAAWRRGRRAPAVLLGWWAVALLPTSGVVPFTLFVQQRYLFAPTAAAALGLGLAVGSLGRAAPRRRWALLLVLGALLLLSGRRAATYALAWRDDATVWEAAARAGPSPAVTEMLAHALLVRGRPEDLDRAAGLARQAIAAGGDDAARSRLVLAEVHLARGEVEAARARLVEAAGSRVNTAHVAATRLATLALAADDLAEGERWLTVALAAAPASDPEPHVLLGQLRLDQGRFDDAAGSLRRAAAIEPERTSTWAWLALAERGLGRPEAALEAARRAGPAGPGLEAQLALDRGDPAAAEAVLTGDHPEARLARARLLRARGREVEAKAEVEALRRGAPPPWLRRLAREGL